MSNSTNRNTWCFDGISYLLIYSGCRLAWVSGLLCPFAFTMTPTLSSSSSRPPEERFHPWWLLDCRIGFFLFAMMVVGWPLMSTCSANYRREALIAGNNVASFKRQPSVAPAFHLCSPTMEWPRFGTKFLDSSDVEVFRIS